MPRIRHRFSLLTLMPGLLVTLNAVAADSLVRDVLRFPRPPENQHLIGEIKTITARWEDTLVDLGERYALGYRELVLANTAVDPWLPREGTAVLLPRQFLLPDAPRRGLVFNLPEMRLYFFPANDAGEVMTFPISIGRESTPTPVAVTRIVDKLESPTWYPPESVREVYHARGEALDGIVPPGPDNPLGRFALSLNLPGYWIHGTNKPFGIGMTVTNGCIRLHPADIEILAETVPRGSQVQIVNQPWKLGWHDRTLYLEAHPTLFAEVPPDLTALEEAITRAIESVPGAEVNWALARSIALEPDGVPHPIGGVLKSASPAPE